MRTRYLQRLAILATISTAALCAQCSSPSGGGTEAVGRVQQGLYCNVPADCQVAMDQCDLYAVCSSHECQIIQQQNGTPCDDSNACSDQGTCQSGTCVASNMSPPQSACWDKAVDPGIPTSLYDATTFLWNGTGRVQRDVTADIDPKRVAVIRGQVRDRAGAAMSGVTVTVVGHNDYGSTTTLGTDGWFDMVVNGGGELVVKYEKDGYLPVERRVKAPWKDYVIAGDVAMTPLGNPASQTVKCNQAGWQVVQGTVEGSGSNQRKVTLLFQPYTLFGATCPDLNKNYNIRIVEYTTGQDGPGADGPSAMPAELPPASGYTFAAELRLEDGTTVLSPQFNNPVISYVDDFLGANVGAQVPSGYYDSAASAWVQSSDGAQALNGVVLQITSLSPAQVDAGISPPTITQDEKDLLAGLYPTVGKRLWRVPLQHFSTVDYNWPFKPPLGATGPAGLDPQKDASKDKPCPTTGSTIACENQVLGEQLPLAGTPFELVYRSDRVPGYKAARQLKIPMIDTAFPQDLLRIDVQVIVAGKKKDDSLSTCSSPPCSHDFTWDGLDIYGRQLNGAQPVTVKLGYVYGGWYTGGQGFGNPGDGNTVASDPTRQEITFWREWKGTIGGWDATGFGLGGWSLDQLHAYSRDTQQLYRGDGSRRTAAALGETISHVMGGSGCPASTCLSVPNGIAFGSDGTLYIAEKGSSSIGRISKIDPNGVLTEVLGNLSNPTDVAVQADGSLVFVEKGANRVRRWDANTQAVTTLIDASFGLSNPRGVAVGVDGSIFVADTGRRRVLRRDAGGTVTVYAGITDSIAATGTDNERLATTAKLHDPWGLAVLPDGSLLIGCGGGLSSQQRVRIVDPAGYIHAFAGGGTPPSGVGDGGLAKDAFLSSPQRVLAAPDGSVYIAEHGGERIRRVSPDGFIRTVAGTGANACTGDGGPATAAALWWPDGLAMHPDGTLYVAEESCGNGTIRRIAPPDFGVPLDDVIGVPSEDGSELYAFWGDRHLATVDAATGETKFTFDYGTFTVQGNTVQLPTAVHDLRGATTSTGRTMLINRDPTSGNLTGFTAEGGQISSVTPSAEGFLWKLTRPAVGSSSSVYEMLYSPSGTGRLTTFKDPNVKEHRFEYNATTGKLEADRDPFTLTGTPFKTLLRTPLASGDGYEVEVTRYSGLTDTYRVEAQADGNNTWRMTGADGRFVESTTMPDESSHIAYPNGTTVDVAKKPDSRFGTSVMVPTTTIALPSSESQPPTTSPLIIERTRETPGASPAEPLNFGTLTDRVAVKKNATETGLVYTSILTRTTSPQTVVQTTPENRSVKVELDSYGRPATIKLSETMPMVDISLLHDSAGRVTQVNQGNRRLTVTWATDGSLSSVKAGTPAIPEMFVVGTAYDARGELTTITRNDNKTIKLSYDASSNLTLLQRPTDFPKAFVSHSFTATDVDLLATYDAPNVTGSTPGITSYSWDIDRRLHSVTWPDNHGVELAYYPPGNAEAGKLWQLKSLPLPSSVLSSYAYEPTTGQLSTISTSQSVTTSFGWDGSALRSIGTTWLGVAPKTVTWELGDYLRVHTEAVTSGNTVTYGYDNDGLITHAITSVGGVTHDFSTPRHAQTGWVDTTVLKKISQSWVHETTYGQLRSVTTKFNDVTNVHTLTLQAYDDLGRIVTKKDKVLTAAETSTTYAYDTAGRLLSAAGVTWGYDANGNRKTVGGVLKGTYDDQDRILTYDGATFTHDANGNRKTRVLAHATTTYNYDAFHNLQSVTLPGGAGAVTYDIDGSGRRVGRHRAGASTSHRYYLLGEGNRVLAEYDGSGTIVSRFVYATHSHVPDYMIKNGIVYRFITDQLGSVRLVVDVNAPNAAASIVQQINYDAWGVPTIVSGSTFDQPFGFAGGLHDRDTGLVHFGAREYDPYTGRWLQKDPIRFAAGDTNLYAYAGNDPVNWIDPSGRVLTSPDPATLEALGNLMNDPNIGPMVRELDRDPLVYEIGPDPLAALSGGGYGDCRCPGSCIIGYDLDSARAFDQSDLGGIGMTPEQLLAHELGHMYGNAHPPVGPLGIPFPLDALASQAYAIDWENTQRGGGPYRFSEGGLW